MPKDAQDLNEGDKVSWKYGQGHPSGTVQEVVTDGQATATSKRGKELKSTGDEENPALVIKADSGSQAIKKASEVDDVKPKP